jgi:hypothetical protein
MKHCKQCDREVPDIFVLEVGKLVFCSPTCEAAFISPGTQAITGVTKDVALSAARTIGVSDQDIEEAERALQTPNYSVDVVGCQHPEDRQVSIEIPLDWCSRCGAYDTGVNHWRYPEGGARRRSEETKVVGPELCAACPYHDDDAETKVRRLERAFLIVRTALISVERELKEQPTRAWMELLETIRKALEQTKGHG